MVNEHHFKVERTAHYYTIGQPGPHIKRFWLVCHGYGQLASQIIHKFRDFDDGQTLVLAAEGLSRFYWKGVSGQVGASWMTSKDRLEEIEDYCRMLDQLYHQYVPQCSDEVKITFFGFSQGCATHCRWLHSRCPHFAHLVLWAGIFPDDLDYRPLSDYLHNKSIHLLYGDQDQFLTPERIEKLHALIKDKGLTVDIHPFEGKHEILRPILNQLAERLS
ncbi:MAG: phospholipase [Bacteroidota bacterium]